ncbi:aldehyde dehydrogenase family protein [Streptomyces sp. RB6PN25]|uniref:Aldehyde dehydrogenase family protein n=1 Tax=Streptomyces humicola TaxID=2953240 RepID=A0ABT1PNE2_9ACTN|nr:aldehyde dehydrogenase family protein [Streptomyces humicola]MCQ4079201.1 aldehyde dehydrogenase family protein [Streptomyces humicola]
MSDIPTYGLHIDGQRVETGQWMEIRNPQNNVVVARVAKGGSEHIDQAVAAAKRSFESGVWSRLEPVDRSRTMAQIAAQLAEQIDTLLAAEIMANGATVRQAAGFHVGLASGHMNYFAELAARYEFERAVPPALYPTLGQSIIRREPIGVCGAITPWNFPLVLTLWKIGPAIAAGNSMVIKPDEKTPLSLLEFVRIAEECGLPPGVINVVPGVGEEAGVRLVEHSDVGKIAFTGSTAVGREIMSSAAATVKRVSLELGGKSPSILLDDADLDLAADGILFGCFLYSGQMCESGTRVLVPRSLHDEFVARLVDRAKTIKLGAIDDWETDLGPVISGAQQARIMELIRSGVDEGAKLVLGGGVPEGPEFEQGFWVEPTIFTEVTNDMRIAREEIFGPVLSVLVYDDEEEMLRIANDTIYGLAATIWSSDNERALDLSKKLQAGTVWINDHHQVNPSAPFGGFKQSGLGRELGVDCLDEYTEPKHVYLDLSGKRESRPYDLLLSHVD